MKNSMTEMKREHPVVAIDADGSTPPARNLHEDSGRNEDGKETENGGPSSFRPESPWTPTWFRDLWHKVLIGLILSPLVPRGERGKSGGGREDVQMKLAAFAPVLALLLVSAIGVGLVGLRVVLTRHWQQLYLVWNLFLAWLPLALAWRVQMLERRGAARDWKFWTTASAWLLFFPNAPYIFTDLVHLTSRWQSRYWPDLTLILLFAMTGFLLGFLSLYLMQSLVARRLGWRMGWLFVAVVAGLSSFGIYLGRFLRWNTWDILLNPIDLLRDVGGMAAHPLAHGGPVRFQLLFALFLFLAYLMLYALTHLRPPQFAALPASVEPLPYS